MFFGDRWHRCWHINFVKELNFPLFCCGAQLLLIKGLNQEVVIEIQGILLSWFLSGVISVKIYQCVQFLIAPLLWDVASILNKHSVIAHILCCRWLSIDRVEVGHQRWQVLNRFVCHTWIPESINCICWFLHHKRRSSRVLWFSNLILNIQLTVVYL